MSVLSVSAEIIAQTITASADLAASTISADAEMVTKVYTTSGFDVYDGDTEYTPSAETQTISTKNMIVTDDITINPIPSNYGLVTWNGSYLTVS